MIKLTELLNEIKINFARVEGFDPKEIKKDITRFISNVSKLKQVDKNLAHIG